MKTFDQFFNFFVGWIESTRNTASFISDPGDASPRPEARLAQGQFDQRGRRHSCRPWTRPLASRWSECRATERYEFTGRDSAQVEAGQRGSSPWHRSRWATAFLHLVGRGCRGGIGHPKPCSGGGSSSGSRPARFARPGRSQFAGRWERRSGRQLPQQPRADDSRAASHGSQLGRLTLAE